MKKRCWFWLITAIILVGLGVSSCAWAQPKMSLQQKYEQLLAEKENLTRDRDNILSQIKVLLQEKAAYRDEKDALDQRQLWHSGA